MKMRLVLLPLVAVAAAISLPFLSTNRPGMAHSVVEVTKGPLTVWSDYEGRLEARDVLFILSRLEGSATVIELAPEGARVTRGDLLVRFDSSDLEREALKLEREMALAEADLRGLERAELPLELRELELGVIEARANLRAEEQYLEVIIELAAEDLISEQEIKQQREKIEEVGAELASVELQRKLTREVLHPAALKRARAKLVSAERELHFARQQLENSIVLAPRDGIVVYKTQHFGTEFRTVRVGDIVYSGVPFMMLPDLSALEVTCYVPEAELSRVREGNEVYVHPLAYPEAKLRGRVKQVGSMAQSAPGAPAWQQYFSVMVSLDESDPRLRPGMSATVHVLSYHNPEAILIPRAAVFWSEGAAFARVRKGSSVEVRKVQLGQADELNYEVVGGLALGDDILVE